MKIDGFYFSGRDSHRRPAQLELDIYGRLQLHCEGGPRSVSPEGLRISPRVGATDRYVYINDGEVFETADNDGVDALAGFFAGGKNYGLLHRLESNLGWIATTAAIVLAFVILSFTHGIPWVSQLIVWQLPEQVDQQLGSGVMEQLDDGWLSPSQLPEETQARVLRAFEPYLEDYRRRNPDQTLEVKLRHSELIGANAMALPSGIIVFTDDLIRLAENDDELVAILGHEIGHIAHRHSLRSIVQSSLTLWLIVAITGDISAASELSAAVPALLADLAYSRDMETEADDYALAFMHQNNLDPNHFANIMLRLEASHGQLEQEQDEEQHGEEDDDDSLGFLSSHPPTPERIERFQTAPQPAP